MDDSHLARLTHLLVSKYHCCDFDLGVIHYYLVYGPRFIMHHLLAPSHRMLSALRKSPPFRNGRTVDFIYTYSHSISKAAMTRIILSITLIRFDKGQTKLPYLGS